MALIGPALGIVARHTFPDGSEWFLAQSTTLNRGLYLSVTLFVEGPGKNLFSYRGFFRHKVEWHHEFNLICEQNKITVYKFGNFAFITVKDALRILDMFQCSQFHFYKYLAYHHNQAIIEGVELPKSLNGPLKTVSDCENPTPSPTPSHIIAVYTFVGSRFAQLPYILKSDDFSPCFHESEMSDENLARCSMVE